MKKYNGIQLTKNGLKQSIVVFNKKNKKSTTKFNKQKAAWT